jgi:hypothetical protein
MLQPTQLRGFSKTENENFFVQSYLAVAVPAMSVTKRAGSVIRRNESADPDLDLYHNVTDPEHWFQV